MLAQGLDQAQQGRFAAQFRVDDRRVDHVIAVHRTGTRFEQWRRVEVADTQTGEVGHQRYGVVEGEILVELQALGGAQRL